MNYAIIGCGLIGKKRLLGMPAGSRLVAACDTNLSRAEELVKLAKTGRAVADFKEAVADPEVQVVFVSTLNATLAPITLAAVKHGKHVLVEKPAAISVAEVDEITAAAAKTGAFVRVGYNHRYHPAAFEGAGTVSQRRAGADDVCARALRPGRPGGLREGMAR